MDCNNTLTHCDLSDLQCGQTYSVSVFAMDESCSSAVSNKSYVKTGMTYSRMQVNILIVLFKFLFIN